MPYPISLLFRAIKTWVIPLGAGWSIAALLLLPAPLYAQQPASTDGASSPLLRVGSKRFTESYVLAELIALSAVRAGTPAQHRPGLGNTAIVFAALKTGSIDLYVEYTGTITREILRLDASIPLEEMNARLAAIGLAVTAPLGFNNTYALGMDEVIANARGIRTISDLAGHRDLRLGFSQEFIVRADGWPGLRAAYQLLYATPAGLDHGLAYEALAAKRVDVIDLYSTDAKIARYGLRVLTDDRGYFPRYDAVVLYRLELPERFPEAWRAIQGLAGTISAERMIALNGVVELDGRSFSDAAKRYFDGTGDRSAGARLSLLQAIFAADLPRLLYEHLLLTLASLAVAIVIGVPLGALAIRSRVLGQVILAVTGLIQTIPSLALLALLIAAMGVIGFWPALIALSLYALLPIVRNTHEGLMALQAGMRQAALALGFKPAQRLRYIELPLAWPMILAGIKTSAVINVGMATIAAFVGAGGLGERIVQGLAVNDTTLLVAGALPAALLAMAVQWAFEVIEWRSAPWRQSVRAR